MESLGKKLRATRESKGISYDQAGLDTKLAIRYLEALEDENFAKFPGEAYITGFIRNYAAYLDLDVEELLAMYRAIKIQEQPIPVAQLLRRPSLLPKIALGAAAALAIAGVLAGALFFGGRERPESADAGVVDSPAPRIPVEFFMSGDTFEHRFFMGDALLFAVEPEPPADVYEDTRERHRLELVDVAGNDVIIRTPNGLVSIGFNRPAVVDLDNDGVFDLRISTSDYEPDAPEEGARLHFERYYAELSFLPEVQIVPVGATAVTRQALATVIFASPNPHPFTFQANFHGGNMFRWEVIAEPARRGRNERFFQRLDELTVPHVHNGVRVWTSNAQSARFQVIGGGRTVPVELGSPGEVVVADIRWVPGADNVFRLVVTRLEA